MDTEHLEATILGTMLRSSAARDKYIEHITADDFSSKGYDKIFDAMVRCLQNSTPINRESITAMLPDSAITKMMVAFLYDSSVTEVTPELYKRFKQASMTKKLEHTASTIQRRLKQGIDALEVIDEARQQLERMESDGDVKEACGLGDTADLTLAMIDAWASGATPYKTYIPGIDDRLHLSQLTGYNVIAGESGAGKTAMMMHLARVNAEQGNKPSAIFSLEMSKELLCLRMAMSDPRISGIRMSSESISNPQIRSNIQYAVERLKKLPITIVENVYNIYRISRIARRLSLSEGCEMMFLDYIQLAETHPQDTDVSRVSKVSMELKRLTSGDTLKGYPGIKVVAISQYSEVASSSGTGAWASRSGRSSQSHTPQIKALRWSRQIRMDADLVGHLLTMSDPEQPVVAVRFFCEKQRNEGDGWSVDLNFDKRAQTFRTRR